MVLTKADCLTPLQLAQSYTLISRDLDAAGYTQMAKGDLPMTSSKHHQGITELWARLAMGVVDIHEQREEQEAECEEDEPGDDDAGEAEAGTRTAAGAADRTVRQRRRREVGDPYERAAAAAKRARVAHQRAARKLRGPSKQRAPGKGTCAESGSESEAKPVRLRPGDS